MPRPTSPSVAAADLDGRCTDLRRAGLSYRQIARQLGISPAQAHKRVSRTLDRTRREPGDGLRGLELERLDILQVEASKVLAAQHVVIQAGQPVVDKDTGRPYVDHGPNLAAIRTLLAVAERRAKLEGLDAPAKVALNARIHDEAYSEAAITREIERVRQQMSEQDPEWVEESRRREKHSQALDRFRQTWSTPGSVRHNPTGFVGDGLALLLEGLDLDDQEREAAGLEVEAFLLGRVHP
jgi:hypothetical protein